MNSYQGIYRAALLVLLLSGVLACSGFPTRPEAPRVSLVGLKLVSVDLFEQRYQVRLRLKNPNNFDLPIEGVDFRLEVNGDSFADGVGNTPATVPAFGEELLELEVSSNLLQVFRRLQSLPDDGAGGFDYELSGSVLLGNFGRRLPFSQSGRFSLDQPTAPAPGKGI